MHPVSDEIAEFSVHIQRTHLVVLSMLRFLAILCWVTPTPFMSSRYIICRCRLFLGRTFFISHIVQIDSTLRASREASSSPCDAGNIYLVVNLYRQTFAPISWSWSDHSLIHFRVEHEGHLVILQDTSQFSPGLILFCYRSRYLK